MGRSGSLVGVRSMMTVTYLSPCRECLQACSSTPTVVTLSSRSGVSMSSSVPEARIASEAVFQATPRLAAIRAIDIRSITIDLTANMTASRDSFPMDGAAPVML